MNRARRETVDEGLAPLEEVLEGRQEPEGEPEPADVSLEEWLETDEGDVTGYAEVTINGHLRRLKIAALTEDEVTNLVRASRRPGPNGRRQLDMELSKRLQIAYSLNKAAGRIGPNGQFLPGAITHTQLGRRLGGRITKLYQQIAELSGFEPDNNAVNQAQDFFV